MKPVRILYHHRTSAGDEQGVHIRSLQRAFREDGHEVFEVSLVASGDEAKPKEPAKQASGG